MAKVMIPITIKIGLSEDDRGLMSLVNRESIVELLEKIVSICEKDPTIVSKLIRKVDKKHIVYEKDNSLSWIG